jgi:hypothetical protein
VSDRYVILQSEERRPDCPQHDSDCVGPVHCLNGEPEDG